jgi:hypothetical protein
VTTVGSGVLIAFVHVFFQVLLPDGGIFCLWNAAVQGNQLDDYPGGGSAANDCLSKLPQFSQRPELFGPCTVGGQTKAPCSDGRFSIWILMVFVDRPRFFHSRVSYYLVADPPGIK